MRILATLLIYGAAIACAHAQGTPGVVKGQIPTDAQWNSYFGAKVDGTNGSASNLTITAGSATNLALTTPTLSSPTISGTTTINGTTSITAGVKLSGRVVIAAGSITATTSDNIIEVNKALGAATTVNMPACNANAGLNLVIVDGKGDAATNNITLTPSAGNVNGQSTFIMNINRQAESVWYDGSQCVVYP